MMLRRSVAPAAVILICAILLGFVLVRSNYYICMSSESSNDPDLLVYQVDGARKLIFGRDVALLVNAQEKVVLSLSVVGRTYGSLLLWPRDSIQGVVLGDPVQGNVNDTYQFGVNGVDVVYSTSTRKYVLHVRL